MVDSTTSITPGVGGTTFTIDLSAIPTANFSEAFDIMNRTGIVFANSTTITNTIISTEEDIDGDGEEIPTPPGEPGSIDHSIGNRIILDQQLVSLRERTDFDSLKKVKSLLDSHFGKDYNQILLPTEDRVDYLAKRLAGINSTVWDYSPGYFLAAIEKILVYEVIIHFPEITISNSAGLSRKIYDLYVSFFLKPDCTYAHPGNMYGVRTTFDNEEFSSGYMHSHLRQFSGDVRFQQFCLGSGPIIQSMTSLSKKFSEIEFKFLCLHLGNYVTWESLEGSPHFRMQHIGNSEERQYLNPLDELTTRSYRDIIIRGILSKSTEEIKKIVRLKIGTRKIEVVLTDKLEEEITQIIIDKSLPGAYKVLCFKSVEGNYHSIPRRNQSANRETSEPILTFKEQVKYLKIIKIKEEIKKVKYAHPDITREVCKQLGYLFTNEFVEAEGITFNEDSGGDIR